MFVNFAFSPSTSVLSWLFVHQSPFSVFPSLLSLFSPFHLSKLAFLHFLSILFFSFRVCTFRGTSSFIPSLPTWHPLQLVPDRLWELFHTQSLFPTYLLRFYSDTYVAFLRIFLCSTHGDIGKILDNFFRIFCFTGSTFTSVMHNNIILKLFIFLSNDSTWIYDGTKFPDS